MSLKENDRMAYNEILSERLWNLLQKTPGLKKRRCSAKLVFW
jgi:hypothetical protein